jgi:hypothetical protein
VAAVPRYPRLKPSAIGVQNRRSHMTGKRIIVFAAFAVAALALALSARGSAEAQTFRPTNSYTLAGNSDSTLSTGIAAPDYNQEDVSATNLNPPDGKTAMGIEAPIGAYVGTLSASAAVGLLGGPCNSALGPNFTLKNASVDIADVLPTTTWILKSASGNPVPDTDGDGLYDYEEQYPWFLNDMLDPDGAGVQLPLQPRARFAGHTTVAGFNVLVQLLVFNPGQITAAGGIYGQMTADKGAVTLVVLDNPLGEGEAEPGAISDFCTPLSTTTNLLATTLNNPLTAANEAGFVRQANPAANTGILSTGTHMALYYTQSERDADGDIYENDFDSCRYNFDAPVWNPRTAACVAGSNPGDQDCDMLPSSCDPNDAVNNTDQDADGYDNAQDNCPMVANGCKSAACGPTWNVGWDNQEDTDSGLTNTDLGPRTDSLGDACDDSDDDGNEGGGVGSCNNGIDDNGNTTTDGADPACVPNMDSVDKPTRGVPPNPHDGVYYHGMPWAAACVGSVDTDGDGYCDILEGALGSQANNGAETGANCTNAIDDDGDGFINDGCPRAGKFSETVALGQCANATSDDTPTPDTTEAASPVVNDGCPVIGVPESLVIDATITAAAARPVATVPQSCSDGVDNDNDGSADAADVGCGATTGDPDSDGWADVLANGFSTDIVPSRVGLETYTGSTAMPAFRWTYDSATGAITIGLGNPQQCWIVGPGDEDRAAGGVPDQVREAQLFCNGTPLGLWRTANLDGTGNGIDEDGDTTIDDGCRTGPAAVLVSEAADHCFDAVNDDPADDAIADDGCPGGPPVAGLISENADWCAGGDTNPDIMMWKVIPTVDDPTGQDNCPGVWNPTQTNTDATFLATSVFPAGDAQGDACDTDDDADGFTDAIEATLPTDPLDRCRNGSGATRSDAWGLDQDLNASVTVVGDVLKYSGKIGASVSGTPPTSWALSRLDLDGNRSITVVGDVLKYSGKIGGSCT